MFDKYQHVERLNSDSKEIGGLLCGQVSVFPKLDGSNNCIWFDDDKQMVTCASRNCIITADYDTTKFCGYCANHNSIFDAFFNDHPDLRLFGEYMTPHTLKTYQPTVWNNFYVFDVIRYGKERNENKEYVSKTYLAYEEYVPLLEAYGIAYIPRLEVCKNPTMEHLRELMNSEHYGIDEGKGAGEGIVCKRYGFKNVYGRTVWGKLVRTEFRVKAGVPDTSASLEQTLVDKYLTLEFVSKERGKMCEDEHLDGWNDRYIKGFIVRSFFEFWKDYSWDMMQDTQGQPFDFKTLRKLYSKKAVSMLCK